PVVRRNASLAVNAIEEADTRHFRRCRCHSRTERQREVEDALARSESAWRPGRYSGRNRRSGHQVLPDLDKRDARTLPVVTVRDLLPALSHPSEPRARAVDEWRPRRRRLRNTGRAACPLQHDMQVAVVFPLDDDDACDDAPDHQFYRVRAPALIAAMV